MELVQRIVDGCGRFFGANNKISNPQLRNMRKNYMIID